MRVAATVAAVIGLLMVVAALADGGPGPEPIPLARSRVATPVRLPHPPPIRSTPMFVSTRATPDRFTAWHRRTLMNFYVVPSPTPDVRN